MIIPHDSPQLDVILDALSSQKRRGIVHELSLYPATVSQLARSEELSLPAIHKHIRTLEDSGLILRRKSGRTNFVVLNPLTLRMAQDWIMQYDTQRTNANATLENYISRMQE